MSLRDQLLNKMNDDPWSWWPFVFLRPAKHLPMTSRVVLSAAFLYGVPLGMLVNMMLASAGASLAKLPFVAPVGFTVLLFVLYRLTFARAWNRRANSLRAPDAPKLAQG